MQLHKEKPVHCSSVSLDYVESDHKTPILKNHHNKEYIKLNPEGLLIWQLIDGKNTVKTIIIITCKTFAHLDKNEVELFISELLQDKFICFANKPYTVKVVEKQSWTQKLKDAMEASYTFKNTNHWLTTFYRCLGRYFTSLPAVWCYSIVAILGFVCFVLAMNKSEVNLGKTEHLTAIILTIYAASFFVLILHEFAHALSTKHYGKEVNYFGIGWFWIAPVAFTDTTDMWLAPYRQRIVVDIAGTINDLFWAGFFGMLSLLISSPEISLFCWLFSLGIYFGVLGNLDPLLELDGYYIIMDLFDRPSLRKDSVYWLTERLPKQPLSVSFSKTYLAEICYWLCCFLFIGISVLSVLIVQNLIFKHYLSFQFHSFWQWLLPYFVIVLSFLLVWIEVKKNKN